MTYIFVCFMYLKMVKLNYMCVEEFNFTGFSRHCNSFPFCSLFFPFFPFFLFFGTQVNGTELRYLKNQPVIFRVTTGVLVNEFEAQGVKVFRANTTGMNVQLTLSKITSFCKTFSLGSKNKHSYIFPFNKRTNN